MENSVSLQRLPRSGGLARQSEQGVFPFAAPSLDVPFAFVPDPLPFVLESMRVASFASLLPLEAMHGAIATCRAAIESSRGLTRVATALFVDRPATTIDAIRALPPGLVTIAPKLPRVAPPEAAVALFDAAEEVVAPTTRPEEIRSIETAVEIVEAPSSVSELSKQAGEPLATSRGDEITPPSSVGAPSSASEPGRKGRRGRR